MPKNKLQGTVFGLIMSYAMAIGMEVYNIAYKMGFHLADGGFSSMTNAVLPECQPHSFLPSGRHCIKELSDGILLEYVCRSAVQPLAVSAHFQQITIRSYGS